MRRLSFLPLSGAILAADLASKSLVFDWLERHGYGWGRVHWIFPEWFGVTRVMNPGVTGGLGAGIPPLALTAFTFLAVVGIGLYLLLPKVQGRVTSTGLALILGGAVGNLWDRFAFGEVRDWIDVWPRLSWPAWLFHWPTFNVADSGIVCGVTLLVFHSLFLAKEEKKG